MDKNFNIEENNERTNEFIGGRSFDQIASDNQNEVIRSYVTDSQFNKGRFIMVVVCRNGKKYVVAGNHHAPTYLTPYHESSDISG